MDIACLQTSPFKAVILLSFWAIPPKKKQQQQQTKFGKHSLVKHFPNRSANWSLHLYFSRPLP